jgi:hypothetical protein
MRYIRRGAQLCAPTDLVFHRIEKGYISYRYFVETLHVTSLQSAAPDSLITNYVSQLHLCPLSILGASII